MSYPQGEVATMKAAVRIGGLGMEGILIGKLLGAHIPCTSRNEKSLKWQEALGADHLINTSKENFVEATRKDVGSYDVVIEEKQILGSRASNRSEFREVVNLVNTGKLDPNIGELIPIGQVNQALANLKNGKYLT